MFTNLFRKAVKAAAKTNYRKVQSWDPLGLPSGTIYAPTTRRTARIDPIRKSIPLSKIEGMPEGGAAARSRHSNNPAAKGVGEDQGFGSGKLGFLKKVGRALFSKTDAIEILPNAQKVFHQQREAIAKRLAPTEFLRDLEYKIRTPSSGSVIVRAGGSEVTFGMIGGELLPEMVTTAQAHRRQGIASYMYRIAEESTGMRISTKATKTDLGAAFVSKRKFKQLDLSALHNEQVRFAMQATTDIVKADTGRATVGGLARHPRRGGSSQGPQGGT